MPRIAVVLSTIGAFLLAVAVVAVLTSQVMAFETENAAATVPGGTTQFQDPDENLLMAPTNNETLPLLKDDTSDNAQTSGSTLQLAPGTTLQIMGGSGPSSLGLQSGVPMDRSSTGATRQIIRASSRVPDSNQLELAEGAVDHPPVPTSASLARLDANVDMHHISAS